LLTFIILSRCTDSWTSRVDYTGCIWNAWTNFKSDLFADYTGCIWNAWTNCKSDFFSEYTGRIWNAWM